MKVFITILILLLAGGLFILISNDQEACAGGKCHFRMTCLGNANITATVCTYNCSDSGTKEKVKQAFKDKMNCGSPSTPGSSNSSSGWRNCDITVD